MTYLHTLKELTGGKIDEIGGFNFRKIEYINNDDDFDDLTSLKFHNYPYYRW